MPSIYVDADLDDFDFDDIVDHVIEEAKRSRNKEDIQRLLDSLNRMSITVESLDDQMKYEHITKVFHKYSTEHFEKQLPL